MILSRVPVQRFSPSPFIFALFPVTFVAEKLYCIMIMNRRVLPVKCLDKSHTQKKKVHVESIKVKRKPSLFLWKAWSHMSGIVSHLRGRKGEEEGGRERVRESVMIETHA